MSEITAADEPNPADAWRRVCLEAYSNLPTDTSVTMAEVDAVLLAGARQSVALDTSTTEGAARYGHLIDELRAATGVGIDDVDAILTVCARDAVILLGSEEAQPSGAGHPYITAAELERIAQAAIREARTGATGRMVAVVAATELHHLAQAHDGPARTCQDCAHHVAAQFTYDPRKPDRSP